VDLSTAEARGRVRFGLPDELELRVRSALVAGALLTQLAVERNASVATACAQLAMALGEPSAAAGDARATCNLAAQRANASRAQSGGTITLDVAPSRCWASMDGFATCALDCGGRGPVGMLSVSCEGGEIGGTCTGLCRGSCDGMPIDGRCPGNCSGQCSAKFTNPTCTGHVNVGLGFSGTECQARCEIESASARACRPARVRIQVAGASDAAAATVLRTALERHLPPLLQIALAERTVLLDAATRVQAALTGLELPADGPAEALACVATARSSADAVIITLKTALDAAGLPAAAAGGS
jgi:hypothetical protein